MDLQAAETAHKTEDKPVAKKGWACPCAGCAKAVKQERARIQEEIDKIDLSAPHHTNALGFKILLQDILNPGGKK